MILYFSSTGNCKYTAEKIAEKTADRAVSLTRLLKDGSYQIAVQENESLGFVLPTYFGVLPTAVSEYLERASIQLGAGSYVYAVDTYGFHYGNLLPELGKILQKKIGREQDGDFLLQSVDNWVPNFDLTNQEYVQSALARANELLDAVSADILAQKRVRIKGEWPAPALFMMKKGYQGASHTKNFSVGTACVGCGKCAAQCPLDAISLANGRPVWTKQSCTLCLGCLHTCPVNATAYTKATIGHGQYFNPNTTRDQ